MTTLQAIIDAFLRTLAGIIPFSYDWAQQLEEHVIHSGVVSSSREIDFLVSLMLILVFFIVFRYDWLGLTSALIKSIMKPSSVKAAERTLDQEVVIFLVAVSIPLLLLRRWLTPVFTEMEWFNSHITHGIFFLVGAGLLRFAFRWNKRIRGLNHLRIMDSAVVLAVSLLSIHPAFPLALALWLGFSLTNYHYEAIFKYSMLLIGIQGAAHLVSLMGSVSVGGAMESVGHLNAIAVLVVSFSIAWMIVENLQKNMSENTFRYYQWVQVIAAAGMFTIVFMKG